MENNTLKQDNLSANQEAAASVPQEAQIDTQVIGPKHKSKFLKVLIFVLFMLFFTAAGVFGYWFYQEKIVKTSETTPVESPALVIPSPAVSASPSASLKESPDDWQFYLNPKYNFSFKYPQDCELISTNKDDNVAVALKKDESDQWDFTFHIQMTYPDTSYFNPPFGTELISWLKEKFIGIHTNIPDKPNFEIDGLTAVKIYTRTVQSGSQMDVYVIKDSKLFHFNMLDIDGQGAEEFYDLFLSAFKFN